MRSYCSICATQREFVWFCREYLCIHLMQVWSIAVWDARLVRLPSLVAEEHSAYSLGWSERTRPVEKNPETLHTFEVSVLMSQRVLVTVHLPTTSAMEAQSVVEAVLQSKGPCAALNAHFPRALAWDDRYWRVVGAAGVAPLREE